MLSVDVATSSRDYQALVGEGLLDELGELTRTATGSDAAFVVSDDNVAPLYLDRARTSLDRAGIYAGAHIVPAGERHKRMATLEDICEALCHSGLTRDGVVVALGGGVVGDMAGLAAALYLRSIQVVQVPTTLLSMVDSSVGGKCAVDASMGKNLIGAFLQPSLVVADVGTFATLPRDVFIDGIGEVVKHAVLADERLFEELSERPLAQTGEAEELARVVARNIEIKRDVVGADERERGLRQTLNLGHTIGHAIEAASGYALGHGHCVAMGLCCMTRATEQLGWTEEGTAHRIERCVSRQGLPIDTDLPHADIVAQALFDKKRHGERVNAVIVESVGHCSLRSVTIAELETLVRLGCGAHA